MKKIFLIFSLLPVLILFSGCKKVDSLTLLKESLSEVNDVYFSSPSGDLEVSIISGKREEPYLYDGKSCDKLDFALVTMELDGSDSELVSVTVNGKKRDVILEFNYLTGKHVADLEQKLDGSEEITVEYMDKKANLTCLSKNFVVDVNEALEIGYNHFKTEVDSLCQGGKFNGEGYLRIVDNLSGGFACPMWLFSVLSGEKVMKNIIISTLEPQVLADGSETMI